MENITYSNSSISLIIVIAVLLLFLVIDALFLHRIFKKSYEPAEDLFDDEAKKEEKPESIDLLRFLSSRVPTFLAFIGVLIIFAAIFMEAKRLVNNQEFIGKQAFEASYETRVEAYWELENILSSTLDRSTPENQNVRPVSVKEYVSIHPEQRMKVRTTVTLVRSQKVDEMEKSVFYMLLRGPKNETKHPHEITVSNLTVGGELSKKKLDIILLPEHEEAAYLVALVKLTLDKSDFSLPRHYPKTDATLCPAGDEAKPSKKKKKKRGKRKRAKKGLFGVAEILVIHTIPASGSNHPFTLYLSSPRHFGESNVDYFEMSLGFEYPPVQNAPLFFYGLPEYPSHIHFSKNILPGWRYTRGRGENEAGDDPFSFRLETCGDSKYNAPVGLVFKQARYYPKDLRGLFKSWFFVK